MNSRMKSYDVPHKGLRNALSKLSLLAGNTDYSDRQEIEGLYHLGRDVFTILSVHAADENDVQLAELEARCPGGSTHDKEDHESIEIVQAGLERMLSAMYADSKSGRNLSEDGAEFYLAFSEFHGKYLEHTAEEERVTQLLLWKHFTDEELAEFRQKIMASLEPKTLMLWLKFVVPAQSRAERVGFLTGFKKAAPIPLFTQGIAIIRQELTDPEFASLMAALG